MPYHRAPDMHQGSIIQRGARARARYRSLPLVWIVAALVGALAGPAGAQRLTWGPFQRNPDGDAMEIHLRVDPAAPVTVWVHDFVERRLSAFPSPTANVHKVRIDGLEPGRWHSYAVQVGWHEWTGLRYVRAQPERYRIGVWGDNQDGAATFRTIARAMVAEGCTTYLGTGDYVQHNYRPQEWDEMLWDHVGLLANYLPVAGCRGNHDNTAYGERFGTYDRALTFGGGVRVVFLDAYHVYHNDYGPGTPTRQFLARELASPAWRNARWRIVAYHVPHRVSHFYSNCQYGDNPTRDTVRAIADTFAEVVEAGAHVVLNGHSHAYHRAQVGTTAWFITGGGGGGLDTSQCWQWSEVKVARSLHHFLTIDVSPEGLLIRALDTSRVEFDRVVVR